MRQLVSLTVFAFAIAGCSAPSPAIEPIRVGEALSPSVQSSSAAAPPPAMSSAASLSVPESPPTKEIPREAAPGSTRGTIACGATRCQAPSESCVFEPTGNRWKCAPSSYDPKVADSVAVGYVCDDGLDCPTGYTCCARWNTGNGELTACVARDDVFAQCREEVCTRDGAQCPAGSTCVESTPGAGTCQPPKGPATCAHRKRCPTDKPICALGSAGPICVASGSPEWRAIAGSNRFECTLQTDCQGGDTCSYGFGEAELELASYCSKYNMGYMGTLVCDPKGASFCGTDKECRQTMTCAANRPELPWLGAWINR